MSSERKTVFTKENLDTYLKEVAKEYRKLCGKSMPAELILIGGASILANYGFREMTTDVDAIIRAASSMKDAVNRVGDKFDLPNGWLNADFRRTDSYTAELEQYAVYYKTFSNVLTVRTISAEYLIAMKLRSGRQYKNDLSDVLGILAEHEKLGQPITMEQIKQAVCNLYESWIELPETSIQFIDRTMQDGNFSDRYAEVLANEREFRDVLIEFQKDYPGVTNASNANDIIQSLKERQKKPSVLERLDNYQNESQDSAQSKPSRKRDDYER